jgi:predicted transcriptional regulator
LRISHTQVLRYRRVMAIDKGTFPRRREGTEPLGPLETVIMKELWRSASGTSGEITAALNRQRTRQLSSKTILTCLTRLEAKGVVVHRQEGRSYRFRAIMDEHDTVAWYIGNRLSEVIDNYNDLAVAVFVQLFCEDPYRRQLVRQLLEGLDERSNS